jgi:polyhydroxyalkanoate synthase subunit PhaC
MALLSKKTKRTARRVVDRAVLSFVNGLAYVVDGGAKPTMGNVPKDIVMKRGKLELSRVRRLSNERYELGPDEVEVALTPARKVPLLVIPPLMVRPYVYDLRPEHSMLRTLRNAGFDVFVVDFGVPDRADEGLRLDDYVLDFVPACVDAALAASGARELALVGYCMGGIFALLHAATWDDPRVHSIVTIGAPVDFEKMGLMTIAARLGTMGKSTLVDRVLDRMGNVPGVLSGAGFRLMSGTKAITKYADLFTNLYDEEYVRGFDAIDTWLGDMIPYPKEAFRQLLKEVVVGNKMLKNELVFRDRKADLTRVTCPVLAFSGKSDNIATPAATRGILELTGSRDTSFVEVPGGHVGVVAGSSAKHAVWEPIVKWLEEHEA